MSIRKIVLRTEILLLVCALLLPSTAQSLDGNREGFIVQIGLGPCFTSDNDSYFDAVSFNFKVGQGWSSQISIHITSESTGYDTDYGLKVFALDGVGLSYFFDSTAPSAYITASLGYAHTDYPLEDYGPGREHGGGLAVGAGYEFFSHWSAESALVGGYVGSDGFIVALRLSLNVIFY